ncbi:MAG: Blp family class II bacteriocin, partial [Sediminibacterium sp.]
KINSNTMNQFTNISFEEMEQIEGGMACWVATAIAFAAAAAGGAACAGTLGAGCIGGAAAVIAAYDQMQTACGLSNKIAL